MKILQLTVVSRLCSRMQAVLHSIFTTRMLLSIRGLYDKDPDPIEYSWTRPEASLDTNGNGRELFQMQSFDIEIRVEHELTIHGD